MAKEIKKIEQKTKIPSAIRALSKEEVAELWEELRARSDRAKAMQNACMTDDKQGIRWLARGEFERASYEEEHMDKARHLLLDICARQT